MIVHPSTLNEVVMMEMIDQFPFLCNKDMQIIGATIYVRSSLMSDILKAINYRAVILNNLPPALSNDLSFWSSAGKYLVKPGLFEEGNDILKGML